VAKSSSKRITRPQPARSAPIRTFLGTPPPPAAPAVPSGDSAPSAKGAAPEPVGDAIANAVDLGYRVLDEYLQQGQRAARRFGVAPGRAEAAVDDLQALATRMARYTSDFLGVWAQFVDVALSAGGLAPQAAPGARPAAPAPAGRLAITVRLASLQQAEVAVDVAPDLADRALTVQDLRSADPNVTPIGGVRLEAATETTPARLHVTIPPDQPAGTYIGVVVDDASGRFAGTVTVTVLGAGD